MEQEAKNKEQLRKQNIDNLVTCGVVFDRAVLVVEAGMAAWEDAHNAIAARVDPLGKADEEFGAEDEFLALVIAGFCCKLFADRCSEQMFVWMVENAKNGDPRGLKALLGDMKKRSE